MSESTTEQLRAVVIGGSGQIGGWLLRVLAERGHHAARNVCHCGVPRSGQA